MKKVAVATDNGNVSQHFGHCEGFTIYNMEGRNIVSKSFVSNPGHQPGFLPNYLNDIGVNTVIAGGMGGGAVQIFNQKKIEIITGAEGSTDDVIQKYLSSNLQHSGSICNQHKHKGECEGH